MTLYWSAEGFMRLHSSASRSLLKAKGHCSVCCLQGQGQSEGSMIKIWLCLLYLLNCWFFSNHYKPECSLKKTWLLHSRSRSQRRVTVSMFIQMISSKSSRPAFITKLGFVMYHHELDCLAKRLVCYFQGQRHCKSSYGENMTFSAIFSELLILLLSNIFIYTPPPHPRPGINTEGMGYIGITSSVCPFCPSVLLSVFPILCGRYFLNYSTVFNQT